MVFLPPAFDTLANLAHAHYQSSTENGQDAARWFAWQALMYSTLHQSRASVVAPVISNCLNRHHNLQQPVKDVLQKLLMLAGADLKTTVTEIWHNGQTESLVDTIDLTSGTQKRAAQIVMRDLVTGLNILSAGPSWPLWSLKSSEILQVPTGSQTLQAQEMTGPSPMRPQTPQSLEDRAPQQFHKHSFEMDEDRSREVEPVSPRLRQQSSRTFESPSAIGAFSHTAFPTQTFEKPKHHTDREPETKKHNLRQRVRSLFPSQPLACAVISVIITALVAAVSVLGAFLGVEVRQNKSLQEQLSKLVDVAPTTCTTAITSTVSVTEFVSATASTCASRSIDSCNGLSSGGWYGIGVASGVGIGILFVVIYICISLFRRRISDRKKPVRPGQGLAAASRYERDILTPGVLNWDSTTVGYNTSSVPPVPHINPHGQAEAAARSPAEIGPSHRVLSNIQTSSLTSDPARLVGKAHLHRHSFATGEDNVLQLPDPMAASLQTDE